MNHTGDPYTKRPLSEALSQTQHNVKHFFENLPPDLFYARPPQGWSPAGHLKHLIKSTGPVSLGMKLPKPLLRLLFGRSERVSRRMADITGRYRQKLAEGFKAPLAFRPRIGVSPDNAVMEKSRRKLLQKWDKTCETLLCDLQRWQEADLDRYRLPHPSLGKISVREMLLFTLYHSMHHINTVRDKRTEYVEASQQSTVNISH